MKLKTFLKRFLYFLVGTIVVANLVVLFSGKWYIYSAVAKTYFIGQGGPNIYDLNLFPKRKIKAAIHPKKLITNIQIKQLPKEIRQILAEIETSSLLVMKNDTILFEKYWGEHNRKTISNSFSAVKSMVGVLIGIAVEEGKIGSIDDKVGKYLPAFNKGKLTAVSIRNLLTMSSGLSWSESGANPFSNNAEGYYGSELKKLVLSQTLESKPGVKFNYQSGNTEVLALIIEKVTGKNISTYLNEKIWSKIGASNNAFWNLDHEKGHEKAFCCFYATTRDFAKFGLLILNQGKTASGAQIIPSWYMKEMFKNEPMQTAENILNTRYGLQWWTYKNVKYARGILGQYIIVIPDLDMVVVRTGHQRLPNITITEKQRKDKQYLHNNAEKVGHPKDLFTYLKIAQLLHSKRIK